MLLSYLSYYVDLNWLITVLIAIFTYAMVSQWQCRKQYPPGPTPLPIIGNLLTITRKDISIDVLVENWKKEFGELFTIWLGYRPVIFVCGEKAIYDGLVVQRNAFSGRNSDITTQLILESSEDIIFGDFGPTWEALRKLAHSAVRKCVASDNLPTLIDDVVNQCLESIYKEDGPIDINLYMYLAVYNILATTAFGERYDLNDKEFLELREATDRINEDFGIGLPGDFFPYLRYALFKKEKRMAKNLNLYKGIMSKKYKDHKKNYKAGVIRDFTDGLLAAKEESEKEDSNSAAHFTDGNLTLVLFDLFNAGTDTTRITLLWIWLYLSNYPDAQEKLRQEVKDNIGDRMPVQDDKYSCPYTIAVMTEVLRLRPVIRFTLEHKAICDAQLGGFKIPKGTGVYFHIKSMQSKDCFWPEPEVFKPERFLDQDGNFTSERVTGYLPFGLGRRSCPGEKLAKADMFLLITRLVQKCRFSLPGGPGSADLEPQFEFLINQPKEFKLIVEKIN